MYTIYWSRHSGSFACEVMLLEVNASHHRCEVDLARDANRAPWFLSINPMAQIPALKLPDDSVLTESAAIMWHLAEAVPDAAITRAVSTPSLRAQLVRWLVFLAAHPYQGEHHYARPQRATTDPNGHKSVREAARIAIDKAWSVVESALNPGPYLLGRAPSAADIFAFMIANWHPEANALWARQPRLAALCDAISERHCVQQVQQYWQAGPTD